MNTSISIICLKTKLVTAADESADSGKVPSRKQDLKLFADVATVDVAS